ncbi:MAG: hypothetical protein JWP78_202 [Mucilaginibacter sp.]|nr:hypothetical protein [Mucilaginibacter sp.]
MDQKDKGEGDNAGYPDIELNAQTTALHLSVNA